MKNILMAGLLASSALLVVPTPVLAHGGQYRGPGDVVPPNPGGGGGRTPGPSGPSTPGPSGPSTPGPSGPSTPGPAGPATGGPAAPGAAAGRPVTRGGIADTGPDLTRWQFWWEFNKDPFLNLKETIHKPNIVTGSDEFFMGAGVSAAKDTLRPSETDIVEKVLPELKRAIDATKQRDITSSVMVAMAKIGKNNEGRGIKILDVFKPRLSSSDQEIKETAALAMGISQMSESVPDLIALVKDAPEARKMVDKAEVDDRTRSFAAYGLGLVAYATSDVDTKVKAFEALKGILEDTKISSRNVRVAAINGIRLLRPNPEGDQKEQKLLSDAIDALWAYYEKKAGQGEQLIQAHVPTAVSALLGRGSGKQRERFKEQFLKDLDMNGDLRRANEITQSAALALGQLCEPTKEDAKYSKALLDYAAKGKDQQTRYFSIISLAFIGGNDNRNELLKLFGPARQAMEKPWIAMALGVLAYNDMKAKGPSAVPDEELGRALLKEFNEVRNPEVVAAMAVAMGLANYKAAAEDLQVMLEKKKSVEELAGYVCIGLALMGHDRAVTDIKAVVDESVRKPDLLKQAAIALGKLGDKSIVEQLEKLLTTGDANLAKLSAIATAYGYIGDKRTLDPLTKLLFDESKTELARAFAAVALGNVADKELLPWNSKIAVGLNYRAAVETLTNQVNGILDIL